MPEFKTTQTVCGQCFRKRLLYSQRTDEKGRNGKISMMTLFWSCCPDLYLWHASRFHSVTSLVLIWWLEKTSFFVWLVFGGQEKNMMGELRNGLMYDWIMYGNWFYVTRNKQVEILIVSTIANTIRIQYPYILISFCWKFQLKFFFFFFYHDTMLRNDKGIEETANKMQPSTQGKGLMRKNCLPAIATICHVHSFLTLNAALSLQWVREVPSFSTFTSKS